MYVAFACTNAQINASDLNNIRNSELSSKCGNCEVIILHYYNNNQMGEHCHTEAS